MSTYSPTQSGTYSFGVHVSSTSWPYFLAFDNFSLIERGVTAGTGCYFALRLNGSGNKVLNSTFYGNIYSYVDDAFYDGMKKTVQMEV